MTNLLEEFILEKAEQRKICVLGDRKGIRFASRLIRKIGISEYYLLESAGMVSILERKRQSISLDSLSHDFFVLVSTSDIWGAGAMMDRMGMIHEKDWINIYERDFYNSLFSNGSAPRVPDLTMDDLLEIEENMKRIVPVEALPIYNIDRFNTFEAFLGFEKHYHKGMNRRYKRKLLEYYYVSELLNIFSKDASFYYVDVGACGSPFVKTIREKTEVQAFAIDLEKGPYNKLDYYQIQDATQMTFANNSIDAISIQSAFEMFMGDADSRAIKEFSRVLKKGGRILILPLYMHTKFLSTVSPNFYGKGNADEGALECIRTDCWNGVPLGRFYNVSALEKRVIRIAEENGLTTKVYSLPNEAVEKDGFVYLKFIMELTKN